MSNAEARYDCTNPSDQLTIAGNHKITEATFNSYVTSFWGTAAPASGPCVKTWDEINDMISGADCMASRLRFDTNEFDMNSNDVIVSLVDMLETTKFYSIPLFKGIKQMLDVEEFHFYKAKNATGQYDIVFKAVSGSSSMHFDLSDLHP